MTSTTSSVAAAVVAGSGTPSLFPSWHADASFIQRALRTRARPLHKPADLQPLIDHIGGLSSTKVVMLGEASHGTHEFYDWRRIITEQLVQHHGYRAVAVEGDWPNSQQLNRYVVDANNHTKTTDKPSDAKAALRAFKKYPSWMWYNAEVAALGESLRAINSTRPRSDRAVFCGMDMYSLFDSMTAVIKLLDKAEPALAQQARRRYSCFDPYEEDAEAYASSLLRNERGCRRQAIDMLQDILAAKLARAHRGDPMATDDYELDMGEKQPSQVQSAGGGGGLEIKQQAPTSSPSASVAPMNQASTGESDNNSNGDDTERLLFDAEQNARVVKNAEDYYRTMIMGNDDSWNVRDRHMMETVDLLVQRFGKVVVWAHNTHVGDYRATEMLSRGQVNVGGLARERYGADAVFLLGFSTHRGNVIASPFYSGPIALMQVPHARAGSWDSHFHHIARDLHSGTFWIPFYDQPLEQRSGPLTSRLGQRAIGVVYEPNVERFGNYVPTCLSYRYDALIHVDETRAVELFDPIEEKRVLLRL